MLETIKNYLAENLFVDADQITPETDLIKDLGADSLDLVELTMNLEEEYNISIEDEVLKEIHTVGDLMNVLKDMGV